MKPIQVLIADDSPSVRRLLSTFLDGTEDLRVVAQVGRGDEVLPAVERWGPDVLTLDVDMPGGDGIDALRQVMAQRPTPTVMISGVGGRAAEQTLRALDEGAVDFVLKHDPEAPWDPEALRREIVAKVRAASRIRTVRSLRRKPRHPAGIAPVSDELPLHRTLGAGVVVVGSSTGGPVALRQLLSELPAGFPVPIVVVQHIPDNFTRVLAAQLDRHTPLQVRLADDGDPLTAGVVLVAPGDLHLLVRSDGRVHLQDGPAILGHRPAIDVTMQSAAQTFGARTRGVLLTGMGDDGAEGLLAIHVAGGPTFAQDEASSVVWGMPRRAFERGSVATLAPPAEIAAALVATTGPPLGGAPVATQPARIS